MYLEGYEWEGLIEMRDPNEAATEVHRDGGTTITDRKFEYHFSAVPGEFEAAGFRERTL